MKIRYLYLMLLSIIWIKIDAASKSSVSKLRQFWENPAEEETPEATPGPGVKAPTPVTKAKTKNQPKEKEIKVPGKAYNDAATKQLIGAINKDNFELALKSLREGADPNAVDFEKSEQGVSVLGLSMRKPNNLEFVKLLLDWQANPNALTDIYRQETPLISALINNIPNQVAIVKMLLDAQADVNQPALWSEQSFPILPIDLATGYAAYREKGTGREIVKLLLRNGANPGRNYHDKTFLSSAEDEQKDAFEGYEDYFKETKETAAAAKKILDPYLPPVLSNITAEYLQQEPPQVVPLPPTPTFVAPTPVPSPAPKATPVPKAAFQPGLPGSPGPLPSKIKTPLTWDQLLFLSQKLTPKELAKWKEAGWVDVDPRFGIISFDRLHEILGEETNALKKFSTMRLHTKR